MNIKNIAILAACAVGIAFSTGCIMNAGGSFQPCSKPVDQGKYTVLGDRVSGTDSQYTVFGYTFAKPGNPAIRALDGAKAKAPGADALIEVGQNVELLMLGPVQVTTTRVTGTPVKTKE